MYDVLMSSLDHDVRESKERDDEVMELVILNKKLREIIRAYFIGSIANFYYFVQLLRA